MAAGHKIEDGEAKASERPRVILVVGAGDATGGAVAKRFAKEGYVACLVRRNASKLDALVQQILQEGGKAHGFGVDARKEGTKFLSLDSSKNGLKHSPKLIMYLRGF